jgi:hypothetical protein
VVPRRCNFALKTGGRRRSKVLGSNKGTVHASQAARVVQARHPKEVLGTGSRGRLLGANAPPRELSGARRPPQSSARLPPALPVRARWVALASAFSGCVIFCAWVFRPTVCRWMHRRAFAKRLTPAAWPVGAGATLHCHCRATPPATPDHKSLWLVLPAASLACTRASFRAFAAAFVSAVGWRLPPSTCFMNLLKLFAVRGRSLASITNF